MTNQAPKEGGNEVPPLLSLVSLPDLAGSSLLDDNRPLSFHDKEKNPDISAATIKMEALRLAKKSGIFIHRPVVSMCSLPITLLYHMTMAMKHALMAHKIFINLLVQYHV
jgi:hypothetical protein